MRQSQEIDAGDSRIDAEAYGRGQTWSVVLSRFAPVAIGGTTGSGTRIPAQILQQAGMYLGADLNDSRDNLWYTLLLKRPRWLPDRIWAQSHEIFGGLSIFEKAMEGRLRPNRAERHYIALAADEISRHGFNSRRDGEGDWPEERVQSLNRSRRLRPPAERWGWKEPCSMLLVTQMHRFFAEVLYVHVLRHPLDMAFRTDQQDAYTWGRLFGLDPPYEPGPVLPLRYWLAANERVLEQATMLLGDKFLVLRYEEFCRNPREGVEGLLSHVGIEAETAELDTLSTIPRVSPTSGRYREKDLSVFDEEDLERVRALGFKIEGRTRPTSLSTRRNREAASERVSIALCTFQGERFLEEQLDSIAGQTRHPDELIICDDASTDGTVPILRRFADRAPFPVRLEVNVKRLGSTKNFEKAVTLCQGDLIFLADQDDVWAPEKLERLCAVLASRPDTGGVFTDAYLIDEQSRPLGRSLWQAYGFEGPDRLMFARGQAFQRLLRSNVVTGATMGLRASFRNLVLPIPGSWVQDGWIAILLAAVSTLEVIPEPLIRYRVHPGQQIGVPAPPAPRRARFLPSRVQRAMTRVHHLRRAAQIGRRMRENHREEMRRFGEYLGPLVDRLRKSGEHYPSRQEVFPLLEDVLYHYRNRGMMDVVSDRWSLVLQELRAGRYRRFSGGMTSALKDLLLLDRRPKEKPAIPTRPDP